MTEREIETTVTVEKEREVTETYLDDEQVTETVYFCDACGEACDERGGRRPVWFSRPAPALHMPRLAGQLQTNIKNRATVLDGTSEVELHDESGFVVSDESPPSLDPPERYMVHTSGEAIILDDHHLRSETESAVKEVVKNYEQIEPDYDLCAHCKDALETSTETLGTAAHEPTESDGVAINGEGVDMTSLSREPLDGLHAAKLWYLRRFGVIDTLFCVLWAFGTVVGAVAGAFDYMVMFALGFAFWVGMCLWTKQPI